MILLSNQDSQNLKEVEEQKEDKKIMDPLKIDFESEQILIMKQPLLVMPKPVVEHLECMVSRVKISSSPYNDDIKEVYEGEDIEVKDQ